MIKIFSIISSLRNALGHFYEYNLAVSKAAKKNGWSSIKIIPKTCQLENLDDSWKKCIYEIENEKKLRNVRNIRPFLRVLKEIKSEKQAIILLEDFSLTNLILILISAFFIRPKAKLWLLHRFEYEALITKGKACKLAQFFLEKIFGKKNVKYLTDSELVAKVNGKYFKRSFLVLPIPHTSISTVIKKEEKQNKYFWWPGGLIRKEKGLKHIQKLQSVLTDNYKIKLVVADKAKNKFPNIHNLELIPTNLSRDEYQYWMQYSDLILLPYISHLYQYRTSGIFVESIIAGNVLVTSKNTWMAYELKKYDLEELLIDWEQDDILESLDSIVRNQNIKAKLKIMKREYQSYHSLENYAQVMKTIL